MLALPEFRLEVYLGRWEFAARYHLTASDAETLTIRELLDLASPGDRDAFSELALGYTPTWGTDSLREAIAGTYNHLGPEHVLVFAGAEEAIFWAMLELADPGEHAIITVPNYQSMESVVLASGADVSALVLRAEQGWGFDIDEVRRLLRPTTRLIAVNFPNNPSGGIAERSTFQALVDLCDANGIRLFSDEVYRGLELDSAKTLPQAADLSTSAISLNVMSKAYGLPGLRIGWIASRDRKLLERLEQRKHFTSICNAAPSEHLATIALHARQQILERNRSIIATNLPEFDAFFARWAGLFDWEHPQGGCVCFPRYLGDEGASTFCHDLVKRAGVVLLPPEIYRSELAEVEDNRFRIGVGRRSPGPALAAVDEFLQHRTHESSHARRD
jgi:aspartate/methionine/tyrosine aminotransferase